MIQLWHGLNIFLSTENSPFVILQFSFSSCVNGSMSSRPPQPIQFFMTGNLSSSFILYALPALYFFASDFSTGLRLWHSGVLSRCP